MSSHIVLKEHLNTCLVQKMTSSIDALTQNLIVKMECSLLADLNFEYSKADSTSPFLLQPAGALHVLFTFGSSLSF